MKSKTSLNSNPMNPLVGYNQLANKQSVNFCRLSNIGFSHIEL